MNETEFNLIDEPWIRVIDNNCKISEISLKDAILNAHQYKSLCGELPTQDIAVMRLILAVLHTVFSRVDENGDESELDDEDEDEALDRWKALWNKKHFSEKAINDYLNEWHERFWLFHPERPFYQITEQEIKKQITSQKPIKMSKFNGEISESDNKHNFFSSYIGKEKLMLSYPNVARWLIAINSFDDSAIKPQGKNLPSTGVAWLGQLGIVYILGENLFETLMLNLVLINNGKIESKQKPVWEKNEIRVKERTTIAVPSNLAELYTIQSRRIYLFRENNKVTSFYDLAGDLLSTENAFEEPMTIWSSMKNNSNVMLPCKHRFYKQMWREYAVIYNSEKNSQSGVIYWYKNYLQLILKGHNSLKTAVISVEYDKSSSHKIVNTFSDHLIQHAELLSDLGLNWRSSIENEIKSCDEVASAVGKLAKNLYLASGGDDNPKNKHYSELSQNVGAQLFYRLDMPFREWLCSIDPESDIKTDKLNEWQEICKKIVFRYAEELAADTPEQAVTGHFTPSGLMSVPKAMNIFKKKIKEIYGKEGDK